MSDLVVEVCVIKKIKNHLGADRLEIARIKGWDCIVAKGAFKEGDTVVFIPPDSLIPKEIAERLGVINYLAGKQKNRVKTVKLRGEVSQGIIIPNEKKWPVGKDVADYYKIEKYIPPVRLQMGDMGPEDAFFMRMTSIQNINNFPDTFQEGQMVAVTEKCDGCFRKDQKVMLVNGEEKNISEINKGDLVLSYNENNQKFVNSEVEEVIIKDTKKEWISLEFDNERKIVCTDDHLFLTKNRGWVEASDLNESDDLLGYKNE
jgi:RNA ligase (TIGR02306 family)